MKNLKAIRKQKKYTQKEMAERLHITQATYSGYENQKYSPTIETLCDISSVLETPIDEIVGNIPPANECGYDKWLMNNIMYKIKRLNERNLLQLDGFLTAKLTDQEDEERQEYLSKKGEIK